MSKRNKNLLPSIFKNHNRYSDVKRPEVGERCIFSPACKLLFNEFVPKTMSLSRQSSQCMVMRNHPNIVEVLFDGFDQTDFVSPEFLILRELTQFGRAFFDKTKGSMSAQAKRLFMGA